MRISIPLKGFLLGTIFVLSGALSTVSHADGNLVDYYRQMQEQMGRDDFPYTLHKEAGQWDAEGSEESHLDEVIVDEKNGYIRFTEFYGAGGARTETQFVLFRGQENTPVIVWVATLFKGVISQPVESTVHTYGNDGDEWFELDGSYSGLPKLAFSDFLPDNMSVEDANALAKLSPTYASIYYRLPRHGANVEAWLSIRDNDASPLCDDLSAGEHNAAAIKHYCRKLKGRIYHKVNIRWNKQQTRFEVGEKYKFPPDWESIW